MNKTAASGTTQDDEIPLLTRREGSVLWIAFNRPHRLNASTHELETRLLAACDAADQDTAIRAVVLSGTTGKRPAFMAGGDINEFIELKTPDDVAQVERRGEEVLRRLEELRVPVIGALDGPVIGQGALIAACCDLLVAGPDIKFGFPIARTVGNLLSTACLKRIVNLVGLPRARSMILSAHLMDTDELVATGAVTRRASSHAELLDVTSSVAEEVASLAPLTLWGTKSSLRRIDDDGFDNFDMVAACYLSDDAKEAQQAFFAKRAPVWAAR